MGTRKKQLLLHSAKLASIIAAVAYAAIGVRSIMTAAEDAGAEEKTAEPITEMVKISNPSVPKFPEYIKNAEVIALDTEPEVTEIAYSMDWSADEVYLLAKLAMAEAEGEDTEGKALVMLVVLNRVWNEGFPDTIEDVILEEHNGVCQFSVTQEGGRWCKVEPDEDCYKALELVTLENWDESEGALYFESQSDSTWHQNHLQYLFKHGHHYFYR